MAIDRFLDRLGFQSGDEAELLAFVLIILLIIFALSFAGKKDPPATQGEIKTNVAAGHQSELEGKLNDELCRQSAALLAGDMKVNQQEISKSEPEYKDGCWHQSATMKWKR